MFRETRRSFGAAVTAIACGVWLGGAAWSPAAAQSASSIAVDAATPVVQSDNGDDIATLQNIFQDANAPQEPTFPPMAQLVADLKLKRLRVLQGDVYCDITSLEPGGQFVTAHEGEWDLLTSYLDAALAHGLSPHMAVAAYMPRAFVPKGAAATWDVDTVGRYKDYALGLARYIVQRSFAAGAPSVVFEVSNELDIADYAPVNWNTPNQTLLPLGPWGRMLWWIDPNTYNLDPTRNGFPDGYPFEGDVRRVGQGIAPMQKIWNDTIAIVKAENPGKKIEIAGPTFSQNPFTHAEDLTTHAPIPTLGERFLDDLFDPQTEQGKYNSSIDLMSFHYYGEFRNGAYGPATALGYMTDRFRTKLSALGQSAVKLFISEWGPVADSNSTTNYSHVGAAWTAAFLNAALAEGVTMGAYLLVGDAIGEQSTGYIGTASLMAKIDGVYHYKPPANVMKMFAMMTGTRRAVALPTDRPNLGAFAVSDADSAGLLVFNYNSTFTTTDETVKVRFDNLPFDGYVMVERYLVDADTSNLQKFIAQGTTPDPALTGLQRVEQVQAIVQSGQLVLPVRTLGPSAVSFWRILR